MVTLEENAVLAPGPYAPDWDLLDDPCVAVDSALLATLGTRRHCRTPMKRLDAGDPANGGPFASEGQHTPARPNKGPDTPGMATYRCMCGFTMDAPATGPDRAAAN